MGAISDVKRVAGRREGRAMIIAVGEATRDERSELGGVCVLADFQVEAVTDKTFSLSELLKYEH